MQLRDIKISSAQIRGGVAGARVHRAEKEGTIKGSDIVVAARYHRRPAWATTKFGIARDKEQKKVDERPTDHFLSTSRSDCLRWKCEVKELF